MLTPEQIAAALSDRNLATVAARSGLSYQTVWRVASRATRRPSHATIQRLSDYLENQAGNLDG